MADSSDGPMRPDPSPKSQATPSRMNLLPAPFLLLLQIALVAEPPERQPRQGDADFPRPSPTPRHERKIAQVKAHAYDLVLIGDSITHTIGELGGKYAPTQSTWETHLAPLNAINLGYSGFRTEQILWNLTNGELDFPRSPKVVMVLIGTNNTDDRHFETVHSADEVFAGTKAIVDCIKQQHPTTRILVLRIFPRGSDRESGMSPPTFNASARCLETCRQAGELTRQLAVARQVYWMDLSALFLNEDQTINTDLMWDLLHPSPAGTEAWISAVLPTLKRLLKGDPVPKTQVLGTPPPGSIIAPLDAVVSHGRVIDPETGLDGIRNVGIRNGKIVATSQRSLQPNLKPEGLHIDATGLVVAPGFIDLHAHGQSDPAIRYRVRDGVTTALELELGYPSLRRWLATKANRSRIHYGATVSHGLTRAITLATLNRPDTKIEQLVVSAMGTPNPIQAIQNLPFFRAMTNEPLPEKGTSPLNKLLLQGLREGALGIGMAHAYYPGASPQEILKVFQFAGQNDVPVFVHVRERGLRAVQEVVANATATGTATHIVHINSTGGDELPEILQLIAGLRERDLNISVEAYPYTAGSTSINAAFFDQDWQSNMGLTYGDLQWQDTGERLTRETFESYRKTGGTVIVHSMREENIELAAKTPFVLFASDAMPYAPRAHPRSAGTFARILGRYVREKKLLSLPEGIRRITLEPARRLEKIAPAMTRKGRLQAGADADLVVFDPATVIDTATFEKGLSPSRGIQYVLVAGVPVVMNGTLQEDRFPGKPILGRLSN